MPFLTQSTPQRLIFLYDRIISQLWQWETTVINQKESQMVQMIASPKIRMSPSPKYCWSKDYENNKMSSWIKRQTKCESNAYTFSMFSWNYYTSKIVPTFFHKVLPVKKALHHIVITEWYDDHVLRFLCHWK